MRVLIILKYIPSASHHQKSDLLRTTIEAHLMEGHEVVLFTTGKSNEHEWEEIKIKFLLAHKAWNKIRQKFFKKYIGSSLNASIVKSVARYHKKKLIDIVFAECNSDYPALYAYNIYKALGIPYVLREHRSYKGPKDRINQYYLKAMLEAKAVTAVSPSLVKGIKEMDIRDDISYIPNALSNEFFTPPNSEGRYRKWAGSNFLFAGWTRWRSFKRLDLLLEAFNHIITYGYKAKLIIAGPVEPEENFTWAKKYVEENGLADQVWLTGEITRPEIHYLAYDCDCCVIPSDYETFGLPALEALAAGKPVVTTKCNGPEFVVKSNELGRVVERGSAEAIFRGMEDIYKNYEQFNQEEIKHSAYERFSKTAVSSQFTVLYENILRARL